MSKILIIIAIIVLGGVGAWYLLYRIPWGCADVAKVCPDGSSVGLRGILCKPASCPTANSNGQVCIQVITPAKNLATGECKEFPTPCDVPEGWEQVGSCPASQADTADWKTYRNKEYGFEIKYPREWKITTEDDSKEMSPAPAFGVFITPTDNLNIREGFYIIPVGFHWGDMPNRVIDDIVVAGKPAIRSEKIDSINNEIKWVVIKFPTKDDFRIELHPRIKADLMTLEQILSTFKFLE